MEVTYKQVETISEFIDAIRLRVNVFIREQGFQPGWEPDEDDKNSKHFIGLLDGNVIATSRFREISNGEIKIERMAIEKDYRGRDIGAGLLKFMLNEIRKLGPKRIWLRSQVRSQAFWEKCGFRVVSEPYEAYGTTHIDMEYSGKL